MDIFAPLDQYCERTTPGLFAEPLNLFSNLSFIFAGIAIFRSLQTGRQAPPFSRWLAYLLISIGVGSALFHSIATVWAMWADVIPIACFVLTYFWLFLRNVARLNVLESLVALTFFALLSWAAATLANHDVANGGEMYFGTWIALFGITCFYGGHRQARNLRRLGMATCIFSVSLFFRTIDLKYCEFWTSGTHVYWHLLNGWLLYLVTSAYVFDSPGK